MHIHIESNHIDYTGDQLKSLFNYTVSKHRGDSIVAFTGQMSVTTDHMVDMEDVIDCDFIWSPLAVNFIIEIFGISIETAVLYQRSFMRITADVLMSMLKERKVDLFSVFLKGDDILLSKIPVPGAESEQLRKLSVSIATVSLMSGLIHAGINISTDEKIPVAAIGLEQLFSAPEDISEFTERVCYDFRDFVISVKQASMKVKGV
jgi:hypothetical protein